MKGITSEINENNEEIYESKVKKKRKSFKTGIYNDMRPVTLDFNKKLNENESKKKRR